MTIIITGTSSGIGLTLAEYFGKKGNRVFGLSRKTIDSPYFKSIATDITDRQQIKSSIAKILQEVDSIDVLINNAGMGMVGAVEDSSAADITKLFQLNVIGAVECMQEVLPTMRKQKSGKIINISSIGSEMGLPFRGFYSASKSALDKVTEAIRYEVLPWNIQVTAVHLGDIKTNIAENRIQSEVSITYQPVFDKVYKLMNAHVDEGTDPKEVVQFIEQLFSKNQLKPHYYFGKLGQKMGVVLKKILPQRLFEKMMRKYNEI